MVLQRRDAQKVLEAAQKAEAQREEARCVSVELKAATERAAVEVRQRLEQHNEAMLNNARQVKAALEISEAAQRLKMEEIHIDVNSKMAAMKKKYWDKCALTAAKSKEPADYAEAREAEKDYREHMDAQSRADERVRLFLLAQQQKLNPPPIPTHL